MQSRPLEDRKQYSNENSFFQILKRDLLQLKGQLKKFQDRMPHNLITEQMQCRFKQFIDQARILFEQAAQNALESIRSANKVKEISQWHGEAMNQVNQVLEQLQEKKSVDSLNIYSFATNGKSKIEHQLNLYANQMEKFIAFRATFTPSQLKKILKFSFEKEDKHTEQRIDRLPTVNMPGTWGVNPGSKDAVRFSLNKPFILTGFDIIGHWDEKYSVKYWIIKNDEELIEDTVKIEKDSQLYYDDYRARIKVNKGEGIFIDTGEKVDIVIEYQQKMSIPYFKGGKKLFKFSEDCSITFQNSPKDDNCTTASEGMLPTLYGLVTTE